MRAVRLRVSVAAALLGIAGAAPCAEPPSAASAPAAAPPAQVAVVAGRRIGRDEFERTLASVVRQRFYHKAPPEGQMDQVRRDVLDLLVTRVLVVAAARERGVAVDEAAVDAAIAGYEERYQDSPMWKSIREKTLPALRSEIAEQQLLAAMESRVRAVPDPDEARVREFYRANAPLFTEPEQVHASVILLAVDPSAPKAVRDKAREEGRELFGRLAAGADFAELAKIRSADPSGARGGDLGYLHRGMLAENLQQHVDALKPGEVAAPIDVLEGVAIFKLHDRKPAELRAFETVRTRALELTRRELSDAAWKEFIAGLRRNAVIEVDPALVPGIAPAPGGKEERSWSATAAPHGG
jgi:parvulin-like peptidyl-prolyl isomerase